MDEAGFWNLIETTRPSVDNPDEHMQALIVALARFPEAEIIDFARHFSEYWFKAYTWDLWAAAYIIGGGCSDDGFMDFRGWLISKGQKVYENALRNPETLLQVVPYKDYECQIEGFQYVARKAWVRKTGKHYEHFPHPRAYDHPEQPSGKQWEEDTLEQLFPELWQKFW